MFSVLVALISGIIAIFLPLIIQDLDEQLKDKKKQSRQKKCVKALQNIIDKYFKYKKEKRAGDFPHRVKIQIRASLNILKEFKEELFDLDMSYNELFKKEDLNPYFIYIYLLDKVRIYMQLEMLSPRNIIIEKGKKRVENFTEIKPYLEDINDKVIKI